MRMASRLLPTLALVCLPLAAQKNTGAYVEFDPGASELRPQIERFTADRGSLMRFYTVDSETTSGRMKQFYTDWRARLDKLNFDSLSHEAKVDYVMFRNHLDTQLRNLAREAKDEAEVAPFVPFAKVIIDLEETRKKLIFAKGQESAATLNQLAKDIDAARRAAEAQMRTPAASSDAARNRRVVGNNAATKVTQLRGTLRQWYSFYNGYDPMFTWWASEPYQAADTALANYSTFLRERVAGLRGAGAAGAVPPAGGPQRGGGGQRGGSGQTGGGGGIPGLGGGAAAAAAARAGESDDIIGNPIGRDGLMSELAAEMIPYTPEELIEIANKEFAWCTEEMKKASRELGFGDDWKKALEHVKNLHVEPGKQPEVIRDLAREAEKFLEDNDLITVPPIAKETWRMEMMSPERQLVNPFFTGGETISVSYPTNTMSHEQKLMSMRGNNTHFSRATVFHELIPGHGLQGYMAQRYRNYRGLFSTPFFGEGWALYWELFLWDNKFQKTPQDRVGALFWRMHRCARIIFSLSFHLGKMSPDECINLLVERVGHERENAIGEVRRSFAGAYSPLYQAAYLLGGIQLYCLRKELVDGGKMTNKQFHDLVLRENRIPIEMIRASLTKQPLTKDFTTRWRFYDSR